MHFELSDDRRMLADTLNRYVREDYPLEERQSAAASDLGYSAEQWAKFAELGVIGALAPEDAGGFGGAGEDIMVVFEALGRGLVVEPFLATLMATSALTGAGGSAELVEAALSGETRLAFAHGEPDGRYSYTHVGTTAEEADGVWRVSGRKSVVLNGASADQLVVSARISGDQDAPGGIGLFLIDPHLGGAIANDFGMVEGGAAADISFDQCEAALIMADAYPAIETALGRGVLALTAEALGLMEQCRDLTLEYSKTRKQFGRPIGAFQALQHRLVDMVLEIEQARSAVILAAGKLDAPRAERERCLSAAKNLIGRVGRLVAEEAIQIHGGMGMTWEYPVGHFAKRLVMIDHLFGDVDFHLDRFASLPEAN